VGTLQEALDNIDVGEYRHVVSLSGGKDSTALALYLKQNYPEIPAEYIFCDTGVELPETYEYLERLEVILGEPVKRLSGLDLLKVKHKPGRNAFDIWLHEVYGGYLPNPRARWCTRVLKIQPFEQFVGESKVFSYIGIRGDENREGYQSKKPPVISEKPNIIPVYPFKDDDIGLIEVKRILDDSGLGLPKYYDWRSRSGCYFCFYQQRGEWQALKREHPDLFKAAKAYEKSGPKKFTWVEGKSLDQIEADKQQYEVQSVDEVEGCAICHL